MLHAEAHEGRQRAVVLGDGAFDLDLPEGDEEALLELGVEAEQPGGLAEVAAGRGERVHRCGGGLTSLFSPPVQQPQPQRNREPGRKGQTGGDGNTRTRGGEIGTGLSRPETARRG